MGLLLGDESMQTFGSSPFAVLSYPPSDVAASIFNIQRFTEVLFVRFELLSVGTRCVLGVKPRSGVIRVIANRLA